MQRNKWPGHRKDETHGQSPAYWQCKDTSALTPCPPAAVSDSFASQWSSPPCHQVTPDCTAQLRRFPPSPLTPSLLLPSSRAITTQPGQPNKGQQQTKRLLEASPHSQIIFVTSVSRRISLLPVISFKIKIFWNIGHDHRKLPSCTIQSRCLGRTEGSGSEARRLLPSCYSPAEREENGMDLQRAPSCKAVKPNKIQITQSLIQK